MCAGLWWGDVIAKKNQAPDVIYRTMPSFEYPAIAKPKGSTRSGDGYMPAIIGSFPITRLEVINDPIGGLHEKSMEQAMKSSLPVELVDE